MGKDVARLFKSRVALFEGTWLKYFKGTAFVPNGAGWPGKEKDYNKNYEYPEGSIEKEIEFFLKEAMEESKAVAEKYSTLTQNTGQFQNWETDAANPYYDMFADEDMEKYAEVLLWRKYDLSLGITNDVCHHATIGNNGVGTTKSMLDAFIMKDGKPIYQSPRWVDENSSYWGDNNLSVITKNRDTRAEIFFKKPGDNNMHTNPGSHGIPSEPCPNITATSGEHKYTTGYALRKGMNLDGKHTTLNQSTVGSIVFRAAEAYLNYIEASYELNGTIDSYADQYWRQIRRRAQVNEDYRYTISLTEMAVEGETDWGAYSAGQLVDATLYNIRRERRCELMAEGFRMTDLKRWRSMDQMISKPYHVLGFNLWEEMADVWECFQGILVPGENVSPRSFSNYLAPYHVLPNNIVYDGYRWNMAHYLDPVAIQHFIITGEGGDVTTSPLYQNPGWPMNAGSGPQ